ncbi:DUF6223 family protein [Amycolatopsis orientalis]|uniref:DUF6223 family protein n=1 Tax=Amycolatopsis orientalis TaxID=31958 RepID=UPI0022872235|nr:DUF6223 family protein [Amycolatopsis orientalis]
MGDYRVRGSSRLPAASTAVRDVRVRATTDGGSGGQDRRVQQLKEKEHRMSIQIAAQQAVDVYSLSPGRIGSIVAGVLCLVGVVAGGLARVRSRAGTGSGRRGALVAVATGATGVVVAGVVAAGSDGGIGTGNGLAGAFVALALGLAALVLGGLTLARSRPRGDH